MARTSIMNTFGTLPRVERIVYAVVGMWVLAMIAVPIQIWIFGDAVLPFGITLGTGVQAAAALVALGAAWGMRRTWLIAGSGVILAWLVEYTGHTTDFPFGAYLYTDRLQPQIGGVPILVPMAWMMMLPSAWALARMIGGNMSGAWISRLRFCAITAVTMTAWDLFLDPQMVGWDLWAWTPPSIGLAGYFGIPWTNYLGWLGTSFGITLILSPFLRLDSLPLRPLFVIYAVTWALESIGLALFWGQPLPALVGFIAMGGVMVIALLRGGRALFGDAVSQLPIPISEPAIKSVVESAVN